MCGICGIIKLNEESVSQQMLNKMTDSLIHRGPDSRGTWINDSGSVGLGHRRLAVLDLDKRSSQPFHYRHLSIVFNGEIYNYLELKEELTGLGHKFITTSDTEVLIASYVQWGAKCLNRLDGMFAFVIYNGLNKNVFGARDRFGEKPFFYSVNEREFVFGSEIKTIGVNKKKLEINNEAVYRYLIYDLVENPYDLSESFFMDVKKLPPAHFIRIDGEGNIEITNYWKIDAKKRFEGNLDEACTEFGSLFKKSVQRRLRSDVKVGTSLSGGLDSSSILGETTSLGAKEINTFTARFKDETLDEGIFIDELARKYPFNRHEVWPEQQELINELKLLFYHQEEPFGSSSIFAQWLVMKKARDESVIVLLDGQGGDEILAGYEKYVTVAMGESARKNPLGIPEQFYHSKKIPGVKIGIGDVLSAYFPAVYDKLRHGSLAGTQKNKLESNLGDHIKACSTSVENPFHSFDNLNDALYFDTFNYGLGKLLRFSDRNAMAHSREVRLPFLSHELVEFAFSLPANMKIHPPWTKYILRNAMSEILPEQIAWRRDKKGFAPPQANWMKSEEMKQLVDQSEKLLIAKNVLKEKGKTDRWQSIMLAELYKFAASFN